MATSLWQLTTIQYSPDLDPDADLDLFSARLSDDEGTCRWFPEDRWKYSDDPLQPFEGDLVSDVHREPVDRSRGQLH